MKAAAGFDQGFSRAGALFYAWDEDEKTLVIWASELAAAEPARRKEPEPGSERRKAGDERRRTHGNRA